MTIIVRTTSGNHDVSKNIVQVSAAWEFCTNGYPDSSALVNYLQLVVSNAERGLLMSSDAKTISAYTRLIQMATDELKILDGNTELIST